MSRHCWRHALLSQRRFHATFAFRPRTCGVGLGVAAPADVVREVLRLGCSGVDLFGTGAPALPFCTGSKRRSHRASPAKGRTGHVVQN
jgi:hypothetical protein